MRHVRQFMKNEHEALKMLRRHLVPQIPILTHLDKTKRNIWLLSVTIHKVRVNIIFFQSVLHSIFLNATRSIWPSV